MTSAARSQTAVATARRNPGDSAGFPLTQSLQSLEITESLSRHCHAPLSLPYEDRLGQELPQFVVITGLSGSGKGSVLKAFEDLGFYCVDNLPIDLIPKFADLCAAPRSRIQRAAVVVDIREGRSAQPASRRCTRAWRRDNLKLSLVFLEASDQALVRRFEETRRPHPLGRDLPVREGIRLERMLLKPMRQLADAVIDTTRMNVHELRDFIQARFGGLQARKSMLISVVSFGFRFGVPTDADSGFRRALSPQPELRATLEEQDGKDDRPSSASWIPTRRPANS